MIIYILYVDYYIQPEHHFRCHHFLNTGDHRHKGWNSRSMMLASELHWRQSQWPTSLFPRQPLSLHIFGAGWYHTKRHSSFRALAVLLHERVYVWQSCCLLRWPRASSRSLCFGLPVIQVTHAFSSLLQYVWVGLLLFLIIAASWLYVKAANCACD